MKQLEMDSRRGGSARQVHQKHISLTETGIEYVERGRRFDSFILNFSSVFYDGPDTGSIGSRVQKWTTCQRRHKN